jgi:8-amino-7-oxononanoate synthase
MLTSVRSIQDILREILDKRKQEHLYRTLQWNPSLIDFCSNDYLSFARSEKIAALVSKYSAEATLSGSTGSRSISGNTAFAEQLEKQLATFHNAEAALLFNSGYDANVGLFSCIARKGDVIVCDELIHASIIDGCRLSYAQRFRFAHNDASDLEKKLQRIRMSEENNSVFVAVESVYSMDGDIAPLRQISAICHKYGANLVVDEAHSTGVFGKQGRGLLNETELENDVFARVVTFGKAIGAHGAVVLGSDDLRNYLINFARSFIFTTALPVHSLATVKSAYTIMGSPEFENDSLHLLIRTFRANFRSTEGVSLIDSRSPIQSVIIPGNERARKVSAQLQQKGFDVRAILSPSVPAGKERLRISIHKHNSSEQVHDLVKAVNEIISS